MFIKLLDWHPMIIAGSRSLLAAIFLFIMRLIIPPPKGGEKSPFPLWAGAFAYAFTMFSFVVANKLTTAANAIMLQYSAPVWAALLGWRLNREKPHWEHWGSMVLVLGGLLLFFQDGLKTGAFLGDGIAVFSGVAFGATSVFLRMMKNGNPSDSLLLSHIICAVVGIPFIFFYPPTLSVSTLMPIVYMGTIQLGLASLIYAYGMKRISAVQAMLSAMIEPILSPVWVLLVTGEKPAITALAGGAIIITAVAASSIVGIKRA